MRMTHLEIGLIRPCCKPHIFHRISRALLKMECFFITPKHYFAVFVFQKGIVIIDSPGIGESDIMDEIVKQYLPQAFAFIYVINSANAGGVQKDRVRMAQYSPN